MLSIPGNVHRIGLRIALVGGLLQVIVGIGIFFLPIIALCGSAGCRYTSLLSYLQVDMPPAGIGLNLLELALAILPGAAVVAIRKQEFNRVRVRCWLGALCSLMVVYASWIFGLYFLPGGLLLLVAGAILTFARDGS